MVEERQSPVWGQEIPEIRVNEGAQLEQIDFSHYVHYPNDQVVELHFSVFSQDDGEIPRGIMCSETGILMGIPAKGTAKEGPYELKVVAGNDTVEPFSTTFHLWIESVLAVETAVDALDESVSEIDDESPLTDAEIEFITGDLADTARKTQSQINEEMKAFWQSLLGDESPGDPAFLLDRDITYDDVYYLLGRFAHFVIWNADDMSAPGELKEIKIKGASELFKVYDRGCCLVAAPISLFDHKRRLMDGVLTAKAMVAETFQRQWNIEFGGFDKMVSAAWVEMRGFMEEHRSNLEVRHYQPTYRDYQLYSQLRG